MADVYSIIIIVVITRVVHNHIPLCSVNIIQRDEKYTEHDDNWERSEWKVRFCHLQAMTKWWHKSVNFQLHNSSLFRNPSQSLPFFSSAPLSSPALLEMPWKMTEFMSHHDAGEWEKALIVDGSLNLVNIYPSLSRRVTIEVFQWALFHPLDSYVVISGLVLSHVESTLNTSSTWDHVQLLLVELFSRLTTTACKMPWEIRQWWWEKFLKLHTNLSNIEP